MTFSPELEKRFADLVTHYPEGRQKAALIPMLMYGQDEVGSVSPELMAEVAKRLSIKVIEVEEVSRNEFTLPFRCCQTWRKPCTNSRCTSKI